MLTIQIKDGENKVIAVVNNVYNVSIDEEINKGWKLSMKIPVEEWMRKQKIKKWYRISVSYGEKIGDVYHIFDGYITDVTVYTNEIELKAENRLNYIQFRILRSGGTYTWVFIKDIVQAVFTQLNNQLELPFKLWKNDCEKIVSKSFSIGTSFYDVLKFCWESENNLVVRVRNERDWNYLDITENVDIMDGVREYDANYTKGTNIVDWSWTDSMDNIFNFLKTSKGEITNEEFLEETWLLFEKRDSDADLNLAKTTPIPKLSISRDTDWWNITIGNKKNIRLLTWYEWLEMNYLGIIQWRKITVSPNGWIKSEIKISEEWKPDTNILDLVLQNLRK